MYQKFSSKLKRIGSKDSLTQNERAKVRMKSSKKSPHERVVDPKTRANTLYS